MILICSENNTTENHTTENNEKFNIYPWIFGALGAPFVSYFIFTIYQFNSKNKNKTKMMTKVREIIESLGDKNKKTSNIQYNKELTAEKHKDIMNKMIEFVNKNREADFSSIKGGNNSWYVCTGESDITSLIKVTQKNIRVLGKLKAIYENDDKKNEENIESKKELIDIYIGILQEAINGEYKILECYKKLK